MTWTDARRWKISQDDADAYNARLRAEAPLFFDQAREDLVTAADCYWHWRHQVARNRGERMSTREGMDGLRRFLSGRIRAYARSVLPADWFAKLDAYCQRTYSPEYWYGFWCDRLTGEPQALAYKDIGPAGRPQIVPIEELPPRNWTPPFATKQEFYRAFPFKDEPDPEPDPLGQAQALGLAGMLADVPPADTGEVYSAIEKRCLDRSI
jgi:hypothetical protein